jgi:hypothetical protein
MPYLLEYGQRRAGHSLRRRVWGDKLGVNVLEATELIEQAIVLFVGDLWAVEHIVRVAVPTNAFTERIDTPPGLFERPAFALRAPIFAEAPAGRRSLGGGGAATSSASSAWSRCSASWMARTCRATSLHGSSFRASRHRSLPSRGHFVRSILDMSK